MQQVNTFDTVNRNFDTFDRKRVFSERSIAPTELLQPLSRLALRKLGHYADLKSPPAYVQSGFEGLNMQQNTQLTRLPVYFW